MLFLLHCTGYIYRTDATGSWIRSSGERPQATVLRRGPIQPCVSRGSCGGGGGGAVPGGRSMSELKAERSLRALIPFGAGTHAAHRAHFLDVGCAILVLRRFGAVCAAAGFRKPGIRLHAALAGGVRRRQVGARLPGDRALPPVDVGTHAAHRALFLDSGCAILVLRRLHAVLLRRLHAGLAG
eukprot:scaffold569_cov53-Phaeocystis_antarctica.AAC.2